MNRVWCSDCHNVVVQMHRYGAWRKRGLFCLARKLGGQLADGEFQDTQC